MAQGITIAATPSQLMFPGAGWETIRKGVLRSVPGDQYGNPVVPVKPDALEWVDVTLFGVGNTDDVLQRLDSELRARGSALYSYALFRRVEVDIFGVRAVRYRLTLLHGFVELIGWAVAIIAIAFAAVIVFQYVTTGQAPALKDLQALWGSAVTSVGNAAGNVAGQVTNTYLGWVAALGGMAIAVGYISKQAGVRAPRTPSASGSVGVRAGPITARTGTG